MRTGGLFLALLLLMSTWGTAWAQSPNADLAFDMEDMRFILDQIKIAERHAAGENLLDILPNGSEMLGLRTVDGSFNNVIPGQEDFGQADLPFTIDVMRDFRDAQAGTSYNSAANVTDSTPRLISELIVNQSASNPAAVSTAAAEGGENIGPDIAGVDQFFIPNTAPDEGLSAPINAFMTFFGQFFDHGLDLINKGGNGTVFMPLQPDDPLFNPAPGAPNVMVMTRATRDAGPDGILGNEDDTFTNATTPHVDQQQTYGSHVSAQILLRHYEVRGGVLQNSGRLLNGFGNDGLLDTADDGGLATWDTVQAQALQKFGIDLDDQDGNNIPMIAGDLYGNFMPGPNGLPQLVTAIDGNGIPTLVEGNLAAPVDATQALRVNHSFFLDVAHTAAPNGQPDVDTVLNPRVDTLSGQTIRGIREAAPAGFYDDELLGVHFTCGDGRCNENIALTTIHHVFHREHNRLADVAKRVLLDDGNLAELNDWLDTPLAALPAWGGLPFPVSDASLANQAAAKAAIDALDLDWNGQRVFQVARFGTEMQYNRIVFDEFGPTIAGLKDVFEGFHTNVDPRITAEFSQSVYRFGHSMLTRTVDRYDADFNPITETGSGDSTQLNLFEAFLNPLALYNAGENGVATIDPEAAAGAVVRGITRTTANEIDEFVAGVLQNNLVGLPLDLGALNIARGRDVGNPRLNDARRMFFAVTQDTRLKPYLHWADYADNLRHEPSLVNFLAAYGTHPTLAGADGIIGNGDDTNTTFADRRAAACAIVGALTDDPAAYCVDNGFGTPPAPPADAQEFLFSTGTWASLSDGSITTGLDDVDFWNGGLAEERMPFGGYLGSTHNFVFENQLERLQNGDRFYYVGRTADIHLFSELESNSFTALVMRNTDMGEPGAGSLPLNIFSVPHHILEVDQREQFDAAGDGTTADPVGDADLTPLVIRDSGLLTTDILIPDWTRIVQYTGGDHVTIGGTLGDDTIIGGIGDDALIGGDGNDRIEGGDGADLIEGGAGDDIITDLSGPDVIEGGSGNDAISSGNEEDVIFGDEGNDFIVNSSEFGEIFAGLGDDYIFDGPHIGLSHGGAGDDWFESLGGVGNIIFGDNGAFVPAGEPGVKGNDVVIVYGGNNEMGMEAGDDIFVDGPGADGFLGQLGFDWVSFANDQEGVNVDPDLIPFVRPVLAPSNSVVLNEFELVEGLSGSPLGDTLFGTPDGDFPGNELVNFDLIEGFSGPNNLVPMSERRALAPDLITGEPQFGWTGGEIIIGGAGSDLINGESGNDIMDGDASLKVAIRTPDPAIRMGPLGQALLAAKAAASSTVSQADLDVEAAAAGEALRTAAADAVAAANAAVAAANAAVAAENAAQAGLSNLTITDAIGNLIQSAVLGGPNPQPIKDSWQDFLNSCSAALADLGIDVSSTSAERAVEALAAQAAAVLAEADVQQAVLDNNAAMSADAVAPAQAALVTAQAALDAADAFILVDSMRDVQEAIFGGFINPGELSISRVISDDDPTDADTDIAVFIGPRSDYTISTGPNGFTVVTNIRNDLPINRDNDRAINDGPRDLVRNFERLQFEDQTVVLDTVAPINSVAVGQPTISGTPAVGGVLTASIAGVTDADNVSSAGAVTGPVDWYWQFEADPDEPNWFIPILRLDGALAEIELHGETMIPTAAENGLRVRVVGIFQDEDGVFETVKSAAVLVTGVVVAPTVDSFTATPATITEGDTSTLAWTTTNATSVDIDNGVGIGLPANGSVVVNPLVTTTYTLTATGPGGTATALVAVTVNLDSDGDGVSDDVDNCILNANGPLLPDAGGNSQLDTDGDGFGNICDADFNGNLIVDLNDFTLFRSVFGSTAAPDQDLNGDGVVDLDDNSIFRDAFGQPPGPSGLNP